MICIYSEHTSDIFFFARLSKDLNWVQLMEKNNKGAEAADLIKQEEARVKNEAAVRLVPFG